EVCLRLFHLRKRHKELALQITIIDLEERIARVHTIAPLHVNRRDDARDWRADFNVFGARLDHARAGDIGGVRWRSCLERWRYYQWSLVALNCRTDENGKAEERQEWQQVLANHCRRPLSFPSTTSTILPSSIRAMRSANSKIRVSWVTTMSALSGLFATPRSTPIMLRPVS